MMIAKTYATRCGWCGGRAGGAVETGAPCGGPQRGSTLDMSQRAEVPVEVAGHEGGGDAAGLLGDRTRHVAGVGPAALEQRAEQVQRLRGGPNGPGGSAALADHPAGGGGERRVRS